MSPARNFRAPATRFFGTPRGPHSMRHARPRRPHQKMTRTRVCACHREILCKPHMQQQQLRVARDELQAVDNFLLATRGAVLIQDANFAVSTIDTARGMLGRVFARQADQPPDQPRDQPPDQQAVVVRPAPAPAEQQLRVTAQQLRATASGW